MKCPTCEARLGRSRDLRGWLLIFLATAVLCRVYDHYWPTQTVTVRVCP
jgi:hypothetical protein